MGLFDIFKRKREMNDTEEKLDKMWELWEKGKVPSPYSELMTYQSEINNGGHHQYFLNSENSGDLQKEMSALKQILSEKMFTNLSTAYKAYLVLEKNDEDEKAEETLEKCDDIFYEYEEKINDILEGYASKIQL